jgi:hypothetical protein
MQEVVPTMNEIRKTNYTWPLGVVHTLLMESHAGSLLALTL